MIENSVKKEMQPASKKEVDMKILYAVGFSLENVSGRTIGTKNKYFQFSEMVSECRLICIDDSFLYRTAKSVRLHHLIAKLVGLMQINIWITLNCLFLRRYDTIIVRDIPLWLRSAFKLRRIHIVSEVHADIGEEVALTKKGIWNIISPIYRYFIDRQIRDADGVIYNHPSLESAMNRRIGVSTPTIFSYNGADTEGLQPTDRALVRRRMNIAPENIVLLFAGSVSVWHGVDKVLRCFAELARRREDVLLYIVGGHADGELSKLQHAFAHLNRVVFTGPVPREQSVDYINAADLCLMPVNNVRVSPGSPIKLYDYAACGKPIVTQKEVLGYSDVIEDHNIGILVDFDDASSCARVLEELIESDRLGPTWEAHIRSTAIRHLSWRGVVMRWIDYLEKLRERR
ncbi:MAG: glycosyltransferase [Pseudomonadota bacterium]|jgi:glycosyltransferase involved in cell wall biosynthesis|nr:glycosyltransferase [Pseudomonadota bacterium]